MPILHHAGHAHYFVTDQPRISDGGHLAELGCPLSRGPADLRHVGGGGDWEWTIKALRHATNVYLDTSGSVIDEGIVDMAARVLGVDRLLFGCDMSMTAGVGKIRGAGLSAADKRKILGRNMQRPATARDGKGDRSCSSTPTPTSAHYAFRQTAAQHAGRTAAAHGRQGNHRAAVSSAAAITYRNAQSGNEELAEAVRPHRDRLIPLAVINPFYAGWKDDLKAATRSSG